MAIEFPMLIEMDSTKRNLLSWEKFFIQESIELEEKMPSLQLDSFGKSKIRLCLETNILNWEKYEDWVQKNFYCSSFKNTINESKLNSFEKNLKGCFSKYSEFEFWNEDLLPMMVWDNHLIVFGLEHNENLNQIKNHIFILTPPAVLSYLAKFVLHNEDQQSNENSSVSKSLDADTDSSMPLEGLADESIPLNLDFKSIMLEPLAENRSMEVNQVVESSEEEAAMLDEKSGLSLLSSITSGISTSVSKITSQLGVNQSIEKLSENFMSKPDPIWEFISERHDEYYFEAKKNFSAYIVLKIKQNFTEVFRMDPDLEKQNLKRQLFTIDLSKDSPFKRVFKNGNTESFEISQMGWNLSNYKYVCITALKNENLVVGFLVGFKENNLSESDQDLLIDLAKESAA